MVDIAQYPLVFTRLPGWNQHKYHLANKLSNNSIEYKISFTSESLSLGLAAVENGRYIMPSTRAIVERCNQLTSIDLEVKTPLQNTLVACMAKHHRESALHKWLCRIVGEITRIS